MTIRKEFNNYEIKVALKRRMNETLDVVLKNDFKATF